MWTWIIWFRAVKRNVIMKAKGLGDPEVAHSINTFIDLLACDRHFFSSTWDRHLNKMHYFPSSTPPWDLRLSFRAREVRSPKLCSNQHKSVRFLHLPHPCLLQWHFYSIQLGWYWPWCNAATLTFWSHPEFPLPWLWYMAICSFGVAITDAGRKWAGQ